MSSARRSCRVPWPTLQANVPNDPALSGIVLHSQAVHMLGVMPYVLTNAQDLVHGTY